MQWSKKDMCVYIYIYMLFFWKQHRNWQVAVIIGICNGVQCCACVRIIFSWFLSMVETCCVWKNQSQKNTHVFFPDKQWVQNNHCKQFRKRCCKTKRGQSNLEWHFHRSNGSEKCQCIVEVCLVPMILWYAIMTKQQTMLAEPFKTSRTSKGKSAQCCRCM